MSTPLEYSGGQRLYMRLAEIIDLQCKRATLCLIIATWVDYELEPVFTGQKIFNDLKRQAIRDQLSVQEWFPQAVVTHDRQVFRVWIVPTLPCRSMEQQITEDRSDVLTFNRPLLNTSLSMNARLSSLCSDKNELVHTSDEWMLFDNPMSCSRTQAKRLKRLSNHQ